MHDEAVVTVDGRLQRRASAPWTRTLPPSPRMLGTGSLVARLSVVRVALQRVSGQRRGVAPVALPSAAAADAPCSVSEAVAQRHRYGVSIRDVGLPVFKHREQGRGMSETTYPANHSSHSCA